jgi:tetratricopeptide (TPR) repeat protein
MPTVFLSYSRADLPLIEQLEAQLKSHPDIPIWRDQEKIYGGQKWPKVLGEAIADQDVFLLAWSKHSAASHFVEFEWCTAIALKKTIVPCLLDDTPLAPSLRTFHGYRLADAAGLIQSLRGAPLGDVQRREPVIRKLNDITATEETAVLAQAKAIFAQQQWRVRGTVLQTGGDIPTQSSQHRRVLGTWEKRVAIIAGILTVVWTGIQIIDKFWPPPAPSTEGAHGSASESPTIQKLEQFGIVTAALGNFFADMHMTPVPFEQLDRELHVIAQRDHELQARLARLSSREPEAEELFKKAYQAAEKLEFPQAEQLLDQAIQRDIRATSELQEIVEARLKLAAAKKAATGDVQAQQNAVFRAQASYEEALTLLPLTDTELRGVYRMKLGKVLRQAGLGAAGPDIEKFLSAADRTYRAAVKDSVPESREWAEANYRRCVVLRDRSRFAMSESQQALLTDAVTSCKDALTVYTKEKVPHKWFLVTAMYSKVLQSRILQPPFEIGGPLFDELRSTVAALEWTLDDVQFIRSVAVNLVADWMDQMDFGDPGEILLLDREALTAFLTAGLSTKKGDQRSTLFDKSVTALENLLTVYPMKQLPEKWAVIKLSIGYVRRQQAEDDATKEAHRAHLEHAITAWEEALQVFNSVQNPHLFVTFKTLIGTAGYEILDRGQVEEEKEILKNTKASFREALAVTPTPLLPQDSATVQNKLGDVLAVEGAGTASEAGIELFSQAITAYQAALTVFTKDLFPQIWAETSGKIGVALFMSGQFSTAREQFTILLQGKELTSNVRVRLLATQVANSIALGRSDDVRHSFDALQRTLSKQTPDFSIARSSSAFKSIVGGNQAFHRHRAWLLPFLKNIETKHRDELLATVATARAEFLKIANP